ncbi:hypothetical protein G6L68_10245 [Agrobacterium fabrum]|uniref:hypothetical protein n=1 Tax=Agrobacterium fabrum TaxID=1176649 RepID=UPI000EF5F106|nr:hypothetical protein [Agrobacterium fabrum]AYM62924.1 hypothetical protein At12D13_17590 [Agrobacterium fabrum]NTE61023.1 hypothetical protein [Agrobacterium fabrum]
MSALLQQWFENFRDLAALAAQIDAAYWAKVSALATIGSIFVSALALAGLLASLRQTKKAIEEARLSRQDARASSEASLFAAAEANEIANNALHLDSRPWLIIENVEIEGLVTDNRNGENTINLVGKYDIRNIGKTPALNIIYSSDMNPIANGSVTEHARIKNGMNGLGPALPPGAKLTSIIAAQQPFSPSQEPEQAKLNILVEYHGSDKSKRRAIFWVAYLAHDGSAVTMSSLSTPIVPEVIEPYYFAVT